MKRIISAGLPLIVFVTFCGCRKLPDEYTHRGMVTWVNQNVPEIRQFKELYPSASGNVFLYGDGKAGFQAEGYLHNRYVINAALQFDYNANYKITAITNIMFSIIEVAEVVKSPGSGAKVTYGESLQVGPKQWNLLYLARGDFSVLGMKIITNAPISGFNELNK